MTRYALPLVALLALAACAPAFAPDPEPLEGVAVELRQEAERAMLTVTAEPPLERLFLRLPGEGLTVAEGDCELVDGAVECLLRDVARAGVTVAGTVRLPEGAPLGVACRDSCAALYAAREPPR